MVVQDVVKLNLRLPKRLHRRLQTEASANNVSLNTEILNELDASKGVKAVVGQMAQENEKLVVVLNKVMDQHEKLVTEVTLLTNLLRRALDNIAALEKGR
jgi:ribosomal protein L18E